MSVGASEKSSLMTNMVSITSLLKKFKKYRWQKVVSAAAAAAAAAGRLFVNHFCRLLLRPEYYYRTCVI